MLTLIDLDNDLVGASVDDEIGTLLRTGGVFLDGSIMRFELDTVAFEQSLDPLLFDVAHFLDKEGMAVVAFGSIRWDEVFQTAFGAWAFDDVDVRGDLVVFTSFGICSAIVGVEWFRLAVSGGAFGMVLGILILGAMFGTVGLGFEQRAETSSNLAAGEDTALR